MSGQPKYRAWYKPLGIMIEPEKLEMINFETKILGVYLNLEGRGYHKLRMSDFDLMQYTGLKDKNGKEAHHKDIVEFEGSIYVIEWDEVDTGFYLAHHECRDDHESEYHLTGRCIREGEIIGNEFENPELLEV